MKKMVLIFLLGVLGPSAVLGWLALRSAEEQKIILERRTAELYQRETEGIAASARALIDEQRRTFAEIVRQLIAKENPETLKVDFAALLASAWPRKAVGFTLDGEGRLVSPSTRAATGNSEWQKFLWENAAFLGGATVATVYPVPVDDLNRPEALRKNKALVGEQAFEKGAVASEKKPRLAPTANQPATAAPQPAQPEPDPLQMALRQKLSAYAPDPAERAAVADREPPLPAQASQQEATFRNVTPQQRFNSPANAAVSQLWRQTTDFSMLCAANAEGMVTRFVQDRLNLIFWLRPAQAPDLTFGCLLEAESLGDLWAQAMPPPVGGRQPEFVLALLNEKAQPVITAPAGRREGEWKRPFVASEIGEALPHWEAALYLLRPEGLQESARSVRRTLTFLIAGMLAAIACGGWLVVADARRQLVLAQKKTDFVSNVSHELKTPLTSIRMFAELMQSGRAEPAKQSQYLRIIMVEAERLTRLINNVLDFARLERSPKRLEKRPVDLHGVIERTWESHELHLRESGFTTRWQAAPPPYPVIGDEDALAQIVVNLLSNAEKYAGLQKEVELHSYVDGEHVCVSVLDRGSGVPGGEERKIFEAFYRAHDSLANAVEGTGLGLTLAQRLAREHGGEIRYQPREGGGSNFTLRLPLQEPASDASTDATAFHRISSPRADS